jgi:uncharacterized protein (TIGR02217 family)
MTVFVDQRLPMEIEAGAKARPRYSTDVITTDGGWEVRNSRWAYPLMEFDITAFEPATHESDEYDVLDEFLDIFHVCGGSAGAFRFHYWRDKPVVGQQIGVGDGSTTTFQLYRTYTRGGFSRDRKITRPIIGSVATAVAGVGTVAAIDYDTGQIVFSVAPAMGAVITADFDHDIPVRFSDDELDVVGLTDELDQPVNVTLVEIRE